MKRTVITQEKGFTLIELLVAMGIFVISLILVSNFLVDQLTFFKQRSKAQESNIEGIIGLEMMRRDVQNAGYGLLWAYPAGASYACGACGEASNSPANAYNDFPTAVPRAILSDTGVTGTISGSDYLVIKAVNVSTSATASRWTILQASPFFTTTSGNPRIWTPSSRDDNPQSSDRVVALSFGGSTNATRQLIAPTASATGFYTQYGTDGGNLTATGTSWAPADNSGLSIVYGIDSGNLRIPFNRADYFVRTGSTTPRTCASGTGVLYKAVLRQSDGDVGTTVLPLLDCVADMQVAFGLDTDGDGKVNCYADKLSDGLTTVDAANIRSAVKEVRVYILAQEGQYDRSFRYGSSSVLVGENTANFYPSPASQTTSCSGGTTVGRTLNLSTVNSMWRNYRWKLYSFTATPKNLRGDK